MGLIRCHFFSPTLTQQTSLTVALPDALPSQPCPLLYLLHGGTEDATLWFREADPEWIANDFGLIVVSLDALSSSYADMAHGPRYFTYLTRELPAFLPARLPVSTRREDTYIAGFSMGGHGALKAALRCPELYAAGIAISGARDMIPLFEKWQTMDGGPDLSGVVDSLGPIDRLRGSENDLVSLAEQAVDRMDALPALYLSCGLDDYAVQLSVDYHRHLQAIGLPHDWYQAPGIHGYAFAEKALRHALTLIWKGRDPA